jgi:HEPN domain-containing protein
MDNPLRAQAMEWFERGDHDISSAQLLYDQQGYTDSIAYHIQQAIEKYLKGYLVLKGRKPPRVHDLDVLLDAVADFEPGLFVRAGNEILHRRPISAWPCSGLQPQ